MSHREKCYYLLNAVGILCFVIVVGFVDFRDDVSFYLKVFCILLYALFIKQMYPMTTLFNTLLRRHLIISINSDKEVVVTYNPDGSFTLACDDRVYHVTAALQSLGDKTQLVCRINGVQTKANIVQNGDTLHVFAPVRLLITIQCRVQ